MDKVGRVCSELGDLGEKREVEVEEEEEEEPHMYIFRSFVIAWIVRARSYVR